MNNDQNLLDREQIITQSEQTKINLEEKIRYLVKQLEDKDKQCKNQINNIQKDNASEQERMSKENKEFLDEINKNKNQIKQIIDNNSHLKRDFEETCTISEQTIINLKQKIQSYHEILEQQKTFIKVSFNSNNFKLTLILQIFKYF